MFVFVEEIIEYCFYNGKYFGFEVVFINDFYLVSI